MGKWTKDRRDERKHSRDVLSMWIKKCQGVITHDRELIIEAENLRKELYPDGGSLAAAKVWVDLHPIKAKPLLDKLKRRMEAYL